MNILYFSNFYEPEQIAASFRASENAKIWAERGHNVTVFTGYPNYPMGKIFDGYDPKLLTEARINGVRVLRSKVIAKPNTNMIRRIVSALSFFFFGIVNFIVHPRRIKGNYDVVLGTSGTVFAALLGWIYSFFARKPFVFEIRDITYKQMVATGKSADSFGVKVMKFLELFLCKRAAHVVVVTNGFKKILAEEGIPAEKISVITNGVDAAPCGGKSATDKLILSYFGTLGISQNIMDTFPYAKKISELCDDFSYLIIGEGAQREQIEAAVQNGSTPFIDIMRGMTAQELEPYYAKSALSLIALKKSENFRYTIPSKLFQIMGRGIAVLFIGPEGEAAEIIRDNRCGIVLSGSQEEDMQTLSDFFRSENWTDQLILMGKNGAEAVHAHYTRTALAIEYEKLLKDVSK